MATDWQKSTLKNFGELAEQVMGNQPNIKGEEDVS